MIRGQRPNPATEPVLADTSVFADPHRDKTVNRCYDLELDPPASEPPSAPHAQPQPGTEPKRARVDECADSVRDTIHALVVAGHAVPREVCLSDYVPSLDMTHLATLGITPPPSVLQVLSRVPSIALSWTAALVCATEELAGKARNLPVDLDANEERFACAVARQMLAYAANAQTEEEAFRCVDRIIQWAGRQWFGAVYTGLTFAGLAADKIEGQRWVFEGSYDHTIEGPLEQVVPIEQWGIDVLVRGLSGRPPQTDRVGAKQRRELCSGYLVSPCVLRGLRSDRA